MLQVQIGYIKLQSFKIAYDTNIQSYSYVTGTVAMFSNIFWSQFCFSFPI